MNAAPHVFFYIEPSPKPTTVEHLIDEMAITAHESRRRVYAAFDGTTFYIDTDEPRTVAANRFWAFHDTKPGGGLAELEALNAVWRALDPLDRDQQQRVLEYVGHRFGARFRTQVERDRDPPRVPRFVDGQPKPTSAVHRQAEGPTNPPPIPRG